MLKKHFIIIAFLSIFIAVGSISPAFASSQLEVTIDPNSNIAFAKMTYQRSINIDYSDGGNLAESMPGTFSKIAFHADSSDPGMQSLIAKLNSYIVSKGSQANISDLTLDYKTTLTGRATSMSVDYSVILRPTIENFVIKVGSGNSPTLIDVDWRGFGVLGPIVLSTPTYGNVEVNLPISSFEKFVPALGLSLKSSDAGELLNTRLMNGDEIKEQPLGNWHFLFDPTGIQVDALGIAKMYADVCSNIIIDTKDRMQTKKIESLNINVHDTKIRMTNKRSEDALGASILKQFHA